MNKVKINEFQYAIEEKQNDTTYRFTETVNSESHVVKLNEIEVVNDGKSEFLWSDDTTLELSKKYYEDVEFPQISAFISELKTVFRRKTV